MNSNFSQNHFALFGVTPAFQIDLNQLEKTYRDIQSQIHPDRFANQGETERRVSMQWATRVNEAYQTLKKPLNRADYLLQLNGVEALQENNTAMPPEFLVSQMNWREAIMDAQSAHDMNGLEELERELKEATQILYQQIGQLLDADKNYQVAAENLRKLKFMEKLMVEIHDAYEALET